MALLVLSTGIDAHPVRNTGNKQRMHSMGRMVFFIKGIIQSQSRFVQEIQGLLLVKLKDFFDVFAEVFAILLNVSGSEGVHFFRFYDTFLSQSLLPSTFSTNTISGAKNPSGKDRFPPGP